MRIRDVRYFVQKLSSNNLKKGARNKSEITNIEIAEYYFAQKNKLKKVA